MRKVLRKPKYGRLDGCGCGVGRLPEGVPLYTGVMTRLKRGVGIPGNVVSAYDKHNMQFARCYKPENRGYPQYGAKGIEVCYGRREFVSWYLHHLKGFSGERPSVDRIDSSKHYCFCNIRIIEWRENLRDGALRGGMANAKRLIRSVTSFQYGTNKKLRTYKSILEAAADTVLTKEAISRQCGGRWKRPGESTGIYFKYTEEKRV